MSYFLLVMAILFCVGVVWSVFGWDHGRFGGNPNFGGCLLTLFTFIVIVSIFLLKLGSYLHF